MKWSSHQMNERTNESDWQWKQEKHKNAFVNNESWMTNDEEWMINDEGQWQMMNDKWWMTND